MSNYAIETSQLSKHYGELSALDELDLKVPERSIFGFLGPNGAGKTTTIKTLLGLIRPTGGTARILGLDIVRESVALRERIGYLPQQPTFYREMTVRDALRFAARFFYRGPRSAVDDRIDETLELVRLEELADRRVDVLSGGERQRLGIAQAQINHPELLILDEPAAALDPIGRRDVLEIMRRLRKYATIFFSTHILDDVQQVSDGVAILNKGQLVAQGSTDELLTDGGNTVYRVVLRGNADRLKQALLQLAWIERVEQVGRTDGVVTWSLVVTDPEAAEQNLFRELARDDDVSVLELVRSRHELEDVFVRLVEG
jgi:ABC-2 type transport system ATP-binding protein